MGVFLATPRAWWDKLNTEFKFTLDAAADHEHFMCTPYITPEQNAFKTDWTGNVWCSPPWDPTMLGGWVKRGYEAIYEDATAEIVVMLLPVRAKEWWWHTYVLNSNQIRFIRGDLDFVPFEKLQSWSVEPQCLVIFNLTLDSPSCRSYPNR